MAYRDEVLADSPLEYWNFDEASGSTLDSLGSGSHSATATGATVISTPLGNGREFDGVDDTVTASSVSDFMAQTAYTVECWVRYNNVAGMDYPTFFRRDGNGKTFLVRTRANTVGRANIIEAYVSGRTVDTGTTTFNDGEWHHVVVTKSGTTVRLFIDAVEYTTANGTLAAGGTGTSATTYIGRGTGATEFFKGGMDEVAVYGTALSPTRIAAHYNAAVAAAVNAGYTAQPMTATAAAGDATGRGNIWTSDVPVTDDTFVFAGSPDSTGWSQTPNEGTITTVPPLDYGRQMFRVPALTGLASDESITDIKLVLTAVSNSAPPGRIYVHTTSEDWSEGTVTWNNRPTETLIIDTTLPGLTVGQEYEIPVPAGATGVSLASWSNAPRFAMSEHSNASYRPVVRYTVSGGIGAFTYSTPLTASAVITDPVVLAGTGNNVSPEPLTAVAEMTTAIISVETGDTTNAPAAYASALMTDASVTADANPQTNALAATAEMTSVNVGTGTSLQINAPVAYVTAEMIDANVTAGTGLQTNALVASALMTNVSVAADANLQANALAASALTTDAQVTQTQSPTLEVEPMLASATFATGVQVAQTRNPTLEVEPMLASATFTADAQVVRTQNPTLEVEPMVTTSALMTDAQVVRTQNPTLEVGSMVAASALMADVQTTQTQNPTLEAEPMAASAMLTTGGGFVKPQTVAADAFTATADITSASVTVERGPKILAAPMSARAVWKQPAEVNGSPIIPSESDDKFFVKAMSLSPVHWMRLNDTGSTAINRVRRNASPGTVGGFYEGVQTGQFEGPDGRHSVYFDGNATLREHEGLGEGVVGGPRGDTSNTFIFSFKTEKRDQFIMVSNDFSGGLYGATETPPRELFMRNGRIGYRAYRRPNPSSGWFPEPIEFVGTTDLADGQWHTIAIRSFGGAPGANNIGVELYVDGKFEARRYQGGTWDGFPDYIGTRPALSPDQNENSGFWATNVLPPLPSSQHFVGHMSELVTYDWPLHETEIAQLYYAFMGWSPVEAQPAEAFAFTPAESNGRGNQKRALYLWWDREWDANTRQWGEPHPFGIRHNSDNFDPVVDAHGNFGTYDLEGYKIFSRSVTVAPGHGWYTDPFTDDRSIINLDTDIDFGEYDVIMFGDWPDEGWEFEELGMHFPDFEKQKERLVRQLLEANERGVGLLVTQPRLAIDLGIVDRVERIHTYAEGMNSPVVSLENPVVALQGNAAGLYDYGSAVKFPWDIAETANIEAAVGYPPGLGRPMNTDPEFLRRKAMFYKDMNWNNRFRVRAKIDGLTNIPSWTIEDSIYHVDKDVWGDQIWAYKYNNRMSGLEIGDEFVYHGTDAGAEDSDESTFFQLKWMNRSLGTWATPLSNVRAGTVVTTFGEKFWWGEQEVDNPYRDYATTIVLQEGDTLNGRTLGGRIFVNFAEQPNVFRQVYPVDILPGSEWDEDGTAVWPGGRPIETPEQQSWQYSGTRVVASSTATRPGSKSIQVTMPNGSTAVLTQGTERDGVYVANYGALFDRAIVPVFTMVQRGMWWVAQADRPAAGDVRAAATPMTATAEAKSPVVTAQRDGGYSAQPMAALAQVTRVAESTVGDVVVATLPATATATFTGYGKTISVAPMTAGATLVENLSMVFAGGEQIVLTLHGVDATLYLKEEA